MSRPSSSHQLLSVERAVTSTTGGAGRPSTSSSASSSNHSNSSRSNTPFLLQHSNSHHHQHSHPRDPSASASWRQQYSVSDANYIDYQTSLFARPLRRLTWKESGHLLLVNTAMFWPNYLYPPKDRRKVTPERRRRLLFSYAPGELHLFRRAT